MPFYYSAANHERIGPYSMEELIRLYHAGVIQLETEISTADSKETVPFALLWNRWRHSLQIGQPPSPPLPETEPEAPRSFTKQASRDIRDMLPHLLLPLDEFGRFRWIENRRILAIAAVGLLPLVIYAVFRDPTQLGNAFWAMALYFSALWALFFYYVFPTREVRVRTAAFCFFMTGIVSVSALLLLYNFWPLSAVVAWIKAEHWFVRWVGFVLGVGIPEEWCKAFVLFVIMQRVRPFRPQTVLFYGLMSGLGFGIYEGVKYQTQHNFEFALRATGEANAYFAAEYYLLNLVRLTTLPFLHAIWTGMAGYFLGFAFQYPERRGGLLVVAIGLPAFLHGTYNAFSATLGLPVALLSVLALNLYLAKSVDFGNLLNERKPTNPDHS
jgi:RsiW-degrading membrane proteinase PrsW (M82 family)